MIKIYLHNLSEEQFLLNGKITFQVTEESREVVVRIPKIKDLMENEYITTLLGISLLDKETIKKQNINLDFKHSGELMLKLAQQDKDYRKRVFDLIEFVVEDVVVENYFVKLHGENITSDELWMILQIVGVAAGYVNLKELLEKLEKESKEDKLSKMTEREKRQHETLKRLEEAKRRKTERHSDKAEPLTIAKIIIGVIYYYNINMLEVRELNYFTLYYMFSYIHRIDHYELMKDIYTNGHLKKGEKLTHWLN